MVNKSVRSWVALALLGAVPAPSLWAQGATPVPAPPIRVDVVGAQPAEFEVVVEDEAAAKASASEYWLGIALGELTDVVKKQLGIDQGLVVDDVLPDSPAAQAEFKAFDILVKVDGQPVNEPADILKAVNSAKDKELSITLLRGGKEFTLAVKPTKRPQPEAGVEATETRTVKRGDAVNAEIKKLEEALKSLRDRVGSDPLGIWFAKPGVVADVVGPAGVPNNLTIRVTKEDGDKPAKIYIKRDDKQWEVTENELGTLPPDVRVFADRLLGKGPLGMGMKLPQQQVVREYRQPVPVPPVPAVPATVPVPGVAPQRAYPQYGSPTYEPKVAQLRAYRVESADGGVEAKVDQILKKLDQMESRSLEQLQNEVKQLRKELDALRSTK